MSALSILVLEEEEAEEEEGGEVAENPVPNSPHVQAAQDPDV